MQQSILTVEADKQFWHIVNGYHWSVIQFGWRRLIWFCWVCSFRWMRSNECSDWWTPLENDFFFQIFFYFNFHQWMKWWKEEFNTHSIQLSWLCLSLRLFSITNIFLNASEFAALRERNQCHKAWNRNDKHLSLFVEYKP